MAVFRVNKDNNYTTMSNYHLRDTRLSLKAKGLLSEMLSLPDNWDYSLAGLVAINKENQTAIKAALDELKQCGYLKISKLFPNGCERTKIEYIYDIFERPNQGIGFLPLENLPLENLALENRIQINTNKEKTEEVSTEKEKESFLPPVGSETKLVDAFFEEMWKLYPRKKGKSDVTSAAKRRLYRAGRDVVVGAIERYKAEMEREHRSIEYIKYGGAFFNKFWQNYVADEEETTWAASSAEQKRQMTVTDIEQERGRY